MPLTIRPRSIVALLIALCAVVVVSAACGSDDSSSPTAAGGEGAVSGRELKIDYATYNPLSLIIREKGWLEQAGVRVEWVQSAGSNKANEALRAGAIDVGSTAGSAALLARANGSPIQAIAIYSQPEWATLVAPPGSRISSVADLKGASVAATKGTDPYFFLLQSLEQSGLSADDITVQNLQHADGWAAAQNGSVDAWAGLDPITATAEEQGATLIHRNVDFNSYGFLNATENFINGQPELAQLVVDTYERARAWAAENVDETAAILAEVGGLEPTVARKVILERSNLDVSGVPGATHAAVLQRIGPIFVQLGDVSSQEQVDQALASLINDRFAQQANATRTSGVAG